MRMQYWNSRLNAVWVELYAEKAEDPFDAVEMIRLMDKGWDTSVKTPRRK